MKPLAACRGLGLQGCKLWGFMNPGMAAICSGNNATHKSLPHREATAGILFPMNSEQSGDVIAAATTNAIARAVQSRFEIRFVLINPKSIVSPHKSHTRGSADAVALAAVGVADRELVVGIGIEAYIGIHTHAHAPAQLQAVGLFQ